MGALFLLEVDASEEGLRRVSGTKTILLLIKLIFHCEGRLWEIFGDKACGKARP